MDLEFVYDRVRCKCEMCDRVRVKHERKNIPNREWNNQLNIQGRQRLCCCGCGNERLRSLTSWTSCWDIGSYQNPVRKRRGQFSSGSDSSELVSLSFPCCNQRKTKEFLMKHYCTFLCVHREIIKVRKTAWVISSSARLLISEKLFCKTQTGTQG